MNKYERIIIPCRLDSVYCWWPKSINGSEPKFRVCVIIPKTNQEVISLVNKAIEETKEEYIHLWGGKIPDNFKSPIHDGDMEKADNEAYRNCIFFYASSTYPPEIINGKKEKITNHEEVYSGVHANISINFYGYSFNNNNGIAVGLGNIQKTYDDENLSRRNRAVDEFEVIEDEFLV